MRYGKDIHYRPLEHRNNKYCYKTCFKIIGLKNILLFIFNENIQIPKTFCPPV